MSAYKSTDKAEKAQFEGFQEPKKQVVHRQLELIEELYQIDLRLLDFQRKLDLSDRCESIAIVELANARSLITKARNHVRNSAN